MVIVFMFLVVGCGGGATSDEESTADVEEQEDIDADANKAVSEEVQSNEENSEQSNSDEKTDAVESEEPEGQVETEKADENPEDKAGESKEELDEKSEIETTIKNRIKEQYHNVTIDDIRINDDLGRDEEGYYIVLVDLRFEVKNRRKTANEMMRMYSDDLVAILAKKGIESISEACVFWEDEYNNRNLKYAYKFTDGNFYIMDVVGE